MGDQQAVRRGGEEVGEWGVVDCRLEHKRSNWTKLEDHFEEVCLLSHSILAAVK